MLQCVPFAVWGQCESLFLLSFPLRTNVHTFPVSGLRCLKFESDRFYHNYVKSSERKTLVESAVQSVAIRREVGKSK